MNKKEAAVIRLAQLRGEPVTVCDLQEAINVLGSKRSNKVRIPPLRDEVRHRVNSALLFSLGLAIGRSQAEKSA